MEVLSLFDEQLVAFDAILIHIMNHETTKPLVLSAKAGSGKTHTAKSVIEVVSSISKGAVIAPTGRAASQLRKSGLESGTLHSLLYKPIIDEDTGKFRFFVKRDMQEIREAAGDFIMLDEASMVTFEQYDFIRSIKLPLICIGDHRQLPPIDKKHPDFNLMRLEDAYYSYLHVNRRLDEASLGLYEVLEYLLKYRSIPRFSKAPKHVYRTISKKEALTRQFHKDNRFDVVLCGINRTRKKLNYMIRDARGHDPESTPNIGETIVCLRNDMVHGGKINNGELFVVESIIIESDQIKRYGIRNIDDGNMFSIRVYDSTWDIEAVPEDHNWRDENNKVQEFGYGYALSVHKSQGSTIDNVLFLSEDVSYFVDQVKFNYVGMSRARKSLVVAL